MTYWMDWNEVLKTVFKLWLKNQSYGVFFTSLENIEKRRLFNNNRWLKALMDVERFLVSVEYQVVLKMDRSNVAVVVLCKFKINEHL